MDVWLEVLNGTTVSIFSFSIRILPDNKRAMLFKCVILCDTGRKVHDSSIAKEKNDYF